MILTGVQIAFWAEKNVWKTTSQKPLVSMDESKRAGRVYPALLRSQSTHSATARRRRLEDDQYRSKDLLPKVLLVQISAWTHRFLGLWTMVHEEHDAILDAFAPQIKLIQFKTETMEVKIRFCRFWIWNEQLIYFQVIHHFLHPRLHAFCIWSLRRRGGGGGEIENWPSV